MLLTSQNISNQRFLIVGSNNVVLKRVEKVIEHGAIPIVVGQTVEGIESFNRLIDLETDLTNLGRNEVDYIVDGVFVCLDKKEIEKSQDISQKCKRLRIPVNVVDQPDLCTFTLLSTYKDGDFQLGISTNSKGCRLANRLKRHVVNSLPPNTGTICQRIGELRKQIQTNDEEELGQMDDDAEQNSKFNKLVDYNKEQRKERLRWLGQVVEYYPLNRLAEIDLDEMVKEYKIQPIKKTHGGKISLVGAGPGSAELLTSAALQAIHSADLVLSDKLVPQAVLDLIPRTTPIQVAKKFPGNADKAQQELLETGLNAIQQGQHVIRLKQGDPYIFGRGAEEYIYFSKHGYKPEVICGITSALSAPLLANISVTHRNVADQVLFCTGTGRQGALPTIPEFVESRTCVFLMSLHRISIIIEALENKGWDLKLPCCVIERSSCPDQRIIRTRLENVVEAIEKLGSRPPGLLVTGYSCNVIENLPDNEKWIVNEGL